MTSNWDSEYDVEPLEVLGGLQELDNLIIS